MRGCEITDVKVLDVRFPTSRTLAGSDAMNPAPDYSAAYVILETDADLRGYGMTFTIGRGTEIVVAAIHALAPLVNGRRLDDIAADPSAFWRTLAGDPHLRWIGPEKGVIRVRASLARRGERPRPATTAWPLTRPRWAGWGSQTMRFAGGAGPRWREGGHM